VSMIKIVIRCMRTTRSKIVNTEHDIDEGAGSKTEKGRKEIIVLHTSGASFQVVKCL
jgi:hypothetical protein